MARWRGTFANCTHVIVSPLKPWKGTMDRVQRCRLFTPFQEDYSRYSQVSLLTYVITGKLLVWGQPTGEREKETKRKKKTKKEKDQRPCTRICDPV